MHVLAARIGGVDTPRVGAGVPVIDRGIELHPGIAAGVRRFSDHPHQVARTCTSCRRFWSLTKWVVQSPSSATALHEIVGSAHRIVGVLEEHRAVGGAIEARNHSRLQSAPTPCALPHCLHLMKYSMSGWSALSTTILAARRVLPPDLITPAEASAAFMKLTAAPKRCRRPKASRGTSAGREIDARARAAFEDHPLVAVPVQDRVHVVVNLQDEAGRALRFGLDTDVEIDRAVEGRTCWVQQQGRSVRP